MGQSLGAQLPLGGAHTGGVCFHLHVWHRTPSSYVA